MTATATAVPSHHQSILSHLAFLLPHLQHLADFVVRAAPIAIQAGVHMSPQAALAVEALTAIDAIHKGRAAAPTPAPAATPEETQTTP